MEPAEPTSTSALASTAEDLSPLEQDVLDEYERLAENMKKVRSPHLRPLKRHVILQC
jgi:DASH complex subunit DAD3